MLSLQGLNLTFDTPVIQNLDLDVGAGQIVGIVGPSGGGKSSLLRIIAGLQDVDSGVCTWKYAHIKGPSEQLVPGHADIQLVNQDFGLDLYHTVEQNIRQKILYLPQQSRDELIQELLDVVMLSSLRSQQAIRLSGGEQQRLSIARALAAEPELLLLDEPFAHLDVHLKERIGDYVRELATKRDMTCILVSHEGEDILQWCSEIHFMNEGVIQRSATPTAFYFDPDSYYEALFFGEVNVYSSATGQELFRPTECVPTSGEGISVKLISSIFAGAYWRNLMLADTGEKLVLYSQDPLNHVEKIAIVRKNTNT